MREVHAPHEAIQACGGFFVRAVALEQTVQFFHHRHRRLQIPTGRDPSNENK
jgi:hypothetical protein